MLVLQNTFHSKIDVAGYPNGHPGLASPLLDVVFMPKTLEVLKSLGHSLMCQVHPVDFVPLTQQERLSKR